MTTPALDQPARIPHAQATSPMVRRAFASGVAMACAALLAVAAVVSPSSQGLGTHEQLNLPQCGWITVMDVPCVTCGMTTAFAHAVRGSFLQSILAQPMGFVLALATAMTLLLALHVAITGSQVTRLLGRLYRPRFIWLLVAFAAASWVFKIVVYRELIA